jgi:uncharacterized protein (DUF2252 family)
MTKPLTSRERIALGQAKRKHMRRANLADWQPKLRRADPLSLLAESMRGRIPALVPIKYDRMAASPFGFFRGAVPVMAYDLSLGPNTGILTQLCGDAHVRNLGAFAAPDGRLVFDINDFDETIRGPFEWDVKRLAVSLVLAGREADAKPGLCRDATRAFLKSYRTAMHAFAQMPVLELAHYQVHRLHTVEPVSQILSLAERATPLHNLEALTIPSAGSHPRIFKTIDPILTRIHGDLARAVLDSLNPYAETLQPERRHFLAQYTPLDVAFKIVGTGSVGLRDYCIYLQGNGENDPLFLQIKEEPLSAYAPYLSEAPAESHQGRRVVEGQRAMQFQSDPFLGYTTIQGRDFLVRQLNDHKATVEMSELKSAGLLEYATVCGETLARGHARSADPGMIAGYIGTSARFDSAIACFAAAYATQTECDWQTLLSGSPASLPAGVSLHSRRPAKPAVKPETVVSIAAKSHKPIARKLSVRTTTPKPQRSRKPRP